MRMYCPHFIIFCQKIDAMTKIQFYRLQISVKKVHIMPKLICGINETANPDGICDDCKLSMLFNKDIPPNF